MNPKLKEEFTKELCDLIDVYLEKGMNPADILMVIAKELDKKESN